MAEGINVRFSGALLKHIQQRMADNGLYHSASEYIRDLVRKDYEREEERKWKLLYYELQAGLSADRSDFVPLDRNAILAEAKSRKSQ